ncbi:molybdate ABC transporter substrate-binding protein [Desulfosarcina ovata]|uniref:Putative binding protein n=1 Tax=Desulfosarcina ovata subsp. ovata TaxID=2752305 RepID=A0A5K8ALA1_9BACT|nr:molybdate ABC transporter substrate-binding protein [Desulfosarcina ovata]BBO93408.1 putative binding protein [Desulfosarcina ovata subsp. ovata]
MDKRKWGFLFSGWVLWAAVMMAQPAYAARLHIFVGAGLRQPVDQLVHAFEAQTGHQVVVDYGGSGQLLAKINVAASGDLFIPGALFYIEKLEKAGKIRSYRPIVAHTPVIGVNVSQTARIQSFDDLTTPGVRLAMGDPKAMAFGRTAMAICEQSGKKADILKNVTVYGATVKQLAMYVSQGAVDAAIIGRADAFQNRDKISIVDIPKAYLKSETIAAAVLRSAADPALAGRLCDFFSSREAIAVFMQHGFLPLSE